MQRLGVIGIGNTLMCDDGIGMVLLERMKENHPDIPGVEEHSDFPDLQYIHGGSGGMNILHDLARLDMAIIIDSGDFGGRPGEYRIFSPEEVKSVKLMARQSLHEADLLKVIELSNALGESPGLIRIMIIQPERVEMGEGLSVPLGDKVEEYERALLELIQGLQEG